MTRRERFKKALYRGWKIQEYTYKAMKLIYGEDGDFANYNARLLTVVLPDEEFVEARYDSENQDFYIRGGKDGAINRETCFVIKKEAYGDNTQALRLIARLLDEIIEKGCKTTLNLPGQCEE